MQGLAFPGLLWIHRPRLIDFVNARIHWIQLRIHFGA